MTAVLLAKFEWGTVPDWATAMGTLLAFAVALRLLFKELDARREYQEDRRREQARLVSAWLDAVFEPPTMFEWYIHLRNGSEEPVHDVKITLVAENSSFAADPEVVRGEGGEFKEAGPFTSDRSVLPPGQPIEEFVPTEFLPEGFPALGLSFTDNRGRRWKRLPNGALIEVTRRQHRSRKDYMNAWIAGELEHLDN
jgi:hypothetical protein